MKKYKIEFTRIVSEKGFVVIPAESSFDAEQIYKYGDYLQEDEWIVDEQITDEKAVIKELNEEA